MITLDILPADLIQIELTRGKMISKNGTFTSTKTTDFFDKETVQENFKQKVIAFIQL